MIYYIQLFSCPTNCFVLRSLLVFYPLIIRNMPITNNSSISFTNELKRTKSAEEAIIASAASQLAGRAADQALVKCTPKSVGAESWHKNANDNKEHLTVEYTNNGQHVTTRHVYR
ncbi:hypothetical protein BJ166DRAFT_528956 [Pestalotiopsis sp. NC0098]|nr:hypothetical protein BJ166DRAFT_528956 [Pestalotiopsis sp. NC0098]